MLLLLTAGVLGSCTARITDPVWFHLPWRHALLLLGYDMVGWVLLGGIFAVVLRRRAQQH